MWWMAAGDWSAKAVDQYLGADQAHKANRTNIMLARENRDWLAEMSNSAMQRHVADLKKSGLNPALGIAQGGASTPQSQPARVEPTYRSGNPVRVTDTLLAISSAKQLEAQARLTNAEAAITEAKVPHSAALAQASVDEVQERVVRLGQDVERADIEIEKARFDFDQAKKLAPLLLEAQRLHNQGLKVGMAKKELDERIAEKFDIAIDKAEDFVRWLNDIGSRAGGAIADWEDAIRQHPWRPGRYIP